MPQNDPNPGLERAQFQIRASGARDLSDKFQNGAHSRGYLAHHEWVIMPNHVHVLVWPMPGWTLGSVIKSWKQFVALRAKQILELSDAAFWQPRCYSGRW